MTAIDCRALRVACQATLVIAFLAAGSAAAQPTPEQQSAIRNACRSDFMANCAGVQPGGREALACLERNSSRLSSACRAAVSALGPPAPAAAAPLPAPMAPASPSPAGAPAAPPAGAARAPQAPQASAGAPPPRRPTSQQQAAIRSACRADFMTNCRGIEPGGADALACLQSNAAGLSPACQRALAAIAGAPPPATRARAAPPPAVVAAPAPPMPPLSPLAELIITRRCRADIVTVCPLPPGEGRIIACLVANTPILTPRCQGALAQARAMPQ